VSAVVQPGAIDVGASARDDDEAGAGEANTAARDGDEAGAGGTGATKGSNRPPDGVNFLNYL